MLDALTTLLLLAAPIFALAGLMEDGE